MGITLAGHASGQLMGSGALKDLSNGCLTLCSELLLVAPHVQYFDRRRIKKSLGASPEMSGKFTFELILSIHNRVMSLIKLRYFFWRVIC